MKGDTDAMQFNTSLSQWTANRKLQAWVEETIRHCKPMRVHLCDGSDEEFDRIAKEMVDQGTMIPLSKRPNSFWCHSHPDDVARVEECTFICSQEKEDAGPTNLWEEPEKMKRHLKVLFDGCMRGRTMYVIPYCMGPIGSPLAHAGVEITDSPYVVLNMKLMTRMGRQALEHLNAYIPGLHSVGVPLQEGQKDTAWPCNPKDRIIAHFPEEKSIFSYGSGYGGNALLGKKCFALRIASVMAKESGWLAEHMLILGLTSPEGEKKYIAAAFPSACGKTNLAMLKPTLPGWTVECVGDDIAWMYVGQDGRLYAINPEAGYFGVAPGTSMKTNPMAMGTIERNVIFTNTGYADGDVWWEGMTDAHPPHLISWLNKPWEAGSFAAHPNSRFTVSMSQNPALDPQADNPAGVPISAILFGGRRHSVMPLVSEALSWNHGVFLGASLSSETTAAAKGEVGKLRHDPFAMRSFCGYNMGDYFAHWIEMGKRKAADKLPRIYSINWFRRDQQGKLLWPGYGENIRVLKWIFERTSNNAAATITPIGHIPTPEALDVSGLEVDYRSLFSLEPVEWREEASRLEEYFQHFEGHLPKAITDELCNLKARFS